MSIQRVPEVPFAQIANGALRDSRLSFKARGILALVLSNVGEWEATARWIEQQSDKDGETAIQTGLNELTALGYRIVRHEQDEMGRVRTVTEWFHEPRSSDNPMPRKSDHRVTGPTLEDYSLEHYLTEHKEIDTSEPLSGALVPVAAPSPDGAIPPGREPYTADFEAFWRTYPRRVAKKAAWKSWQQAARAIEPQVILEAAQRYRDDPNRDPMYTAHPTTWLNQGRWDDEPLPAKRREAGTGGERRMDNYQDLYRKFTESTKGITA